MSSVICHFQMIYPRYDLLQTDALDLIAKAHISADNAEFLDAKKESLMTKSVYRYGAKPSQVNKRFCESKDFLFGAPLQKKMEAFKQSSDRIFSEIYEKQHDAPQNMIHVSCTGYESPSSAQLLVSQKNWGSVCQVTHAYHMGCYAAFPALRMAQGFLAMDENLDSRVDVVHTEICSLHFNPARHEPDQFVIQSLFGDGFISYSVVKKENHHRSGKGLEILGSFEEIFSNCSDAMTWKLTSGGFGMSISRSVPSIIAENIHGFLKRMFEKSHMNYDSEKENLIFAIHPGGPKIIDSIKEMLSLSDAQVVLSKEILYERGNMSSATIPHIWQRALEKNIKQGSLIVSLAFGPGLTIAGNILKMV